MHGELLEDWEHEEGHRKYEEDRGVHEELLENGEHQGMLEDGEVVLVELVHDIAGAGVDGGQEGGHGDCEAAVDAQEADMQVQVLVQLQGVQRGDPRDTAESEGGDDDGGGGDGGDSP